jgi:hypothetical protein
MQEQSIEKKYEKAFEQAASLHPIFPNAAREQMAKMVEEISITNNILHGSDGSSGILNTEQSFQIRGGNAAEEFHAHTFNMDSILHDNDARAYTDRREPWYEHEYGGKLLGKNDNTDIVITKDGKVIKSHQLKYNKNAESTAGEMSHVAGDRPKYDKNDRYVAPSDQVEGIKEQSNENIRKNIERDGDPARREAYRQTRDKVDATITDGESSSTELTKKEANELGKGNTKKIEEIENSYQTQSTLQQMGKAAVGAAAMSAVVSGSINTVRYIQLAREGKLTGDEAALKIVGETVAAAADSAVKASANAGVQSLMVRYGSEKAVTEVLAKQGLKAMIKSNAVTVGVVCAVDAVKDLVRLGMGDINKEEFFERQGKSVLQTSAGVVGGSLGVAGASTVSVALGASVGGTAMTVASVVGGLSGGIIGGLAMTLAIENGIEKPYRDLVRTTGLLQEAARELERVSQTVFMGQVLFSKYIERDLLLEEDLLEQFERIDRAGLEALDAINKI